MTAATTAGFTLSTSSVGIEDQAAPRVALACLACRTAKRKCSGKQPCELCIARRRPCVFLSRLPTGQSQTPRDIELIKRPALVHDDHLSDREDIFLGSPASLVFFELLQHAMLGADTHDGDLRPAFGALTPSLSDEEILTMPPQQESMDLLEAYLQTAWRHNPVFHQDTLRREWGAILNSLSMGTSPSLLSAALINIICALGAHFGGDDGRAAQADLYADRCAALMALQAHRGGAPSLLLIQVLAHQSFYSYYRLPLVLRDTSATLDRAISLAIQIGLHLEPKVEGIDGEVRRRTWWSLYSLSMMNGCMLGRPLLAAAAKPTCALPKPFPGEAESVPLMFCAAKARLSQLVCEVLENLYFSNAQPLSTAELRTMMDIESALEEWQKALPPDMRVEREGGPTEEAQIMRLIFENCRLLLLRRSVVRLLTPSHTRQDTFIAQSAWGAAEKACYMAAEQLINTAHSCQENVLFRRSCFYHADLVFVAIAVILAGRWQGNDIENFDQTFGQAIVALSGPLPRIAERLVQLAWHLGAGGQPSLGPTDSVHGSDDLLESMLQHIWDHQAEPGIPI